MLLVYRKMLIHLLLIRFFLYLGRIPHPSPILLNPYQCRMGNGYTRIEP